MTDKQQIPDVPWEDVRQLEDERIEYSKRATIAEADRDRYRAALEASWITAIKGVRVARGQGHSYWAGYRDAIHGLHDAVGIDPSDIDE